MEQVPGTACVSGGAGKSDAIAHATAAEGRPAGTHQNGASGNDMHRDGAEGSSCAQEPASMHEVGRMVGSGRSAKAPALPPVAEGTEGSLGSATGGSLMSNVLTGSAERKLPALSHVDAGQAPLPEQQRPPLEATAVSERAHSSAILHHSIMQHSDLFRGDDLAVMRAMHCMIHPPQRKIRPCCVQRARGSAPASLQA